MGVCVCVCGGGGGGGGVGMGGGGAMTTRVRGLVYFILGVPSAGQDTEPCWLLSGMLMIALYSTILHSWTDSLHFCRMQF